MMKKIYALGALALMFASCKPNANVTTPPKSGDAVFTNYLAVGCSYTSGFADSSLTVSGQLNSYPQRLFEQFATISDGNGAVDPFIQPLVTGDNGYPTPKFVLGTHTYCDGSTSMAPMRNPLPLDSTGSWHYVLPVNNSQINNISVPYIRVADYKVLGYAGLNKYAKRFYYKPTQRPLDELYDRVHNLHPTFFTSWLGSTDVLGFALAGGVGDGTGFALPITLNIYDPADITPTAVFTDTYDSIITSLLSTGASGALLNVPDISALPFFTTIPSDGLVINSQEQADSIKAHYAGAGFNIVFQNGRNQYIITDHDNKVRQSVPGELILLSTPHDSILCAGWGSTKPIPNKYVLTTDELQQIRAAVNTYNAYLKNQCELHHLAYVDMYSFMKTLSTGMAYNGINYTTSYISGGAFSLDAVHMNPRGNALVANYVINTINNYYHSTIPLTDANKYPGIKFP